MRARDILRNFYNPAAAESDRHGIREGIVSDVFGTLIQHGALNRPYYNFLLWAQKNDIPVTVTSSEPRRAVHTMNELGCDENLVTTIADKFKLFGRVDNKPFEVIIDDSLHFHPALITIHPDDRAFVRFLATQQYKNLERAQAAPAYSPAP